MYLKNLKTGKRRPFVYSISYDTDTRSIEFNIHPFCAEKLKGLNPENLSARILMEKHSYPNIENSLYKNFGVNNQSINKGLINGLIKIAFTIEAPYVQSKEACTSCQGSGTRTTFVYQEENKKCYTCRGTGKEFENRNNMRDQCASIFLLTRYLNWPILMDDEDSFPENEFGYQNLFLEVDPHNGIGGECSENFFSKLALINTNELELGRRKAMYDLHAYSEGQHLFPDIKAYYEEFQFRCEVGEKGRIYVEVPGINGCSIHMDHSWKDQFTCHNIDYAQQQFCLLAGFAMLWRDYYSAL